MNPENIHDALNLLPDDLIAEADALRQNPGKTIPWKRLIPMAACFALVLGAMYVVLPNMATKDAAPEAAAPMEMLQDAMEENSMVGIPETIPATEAPAEGASREDPEAAPDNDGAPLAPEQEEATVEVSGTPLIPVASYTYCIGSEEPDETQITLISTWKEWNAFLEATPRLTEEGGFENGYEEAYFDKKQLIAVMTTAASSTVRYEATSITKTDIGTWELTITRYSPEWFTDDMEQQLILVEVPRTVEPEDTVILVTVDME